MNKEFFEALEELSIEKGINKNYILDAIETALLTAYKKTKSEVEFTMYGSLTFPEPVIVVSLILLGTA